MLPVRLPDDDVARLRALATDKPGIELTVDLPSQAVSAPGVEAIPFEVDPFDKECLIAGLDDIGMTLRGEDRIAGFEDAYRGDFAWLYRRGGDPA